MLAGHFLQRLAERYGRSVSLNGAALDHLLAYPFPGNVRELSHILESAVAVSTDSPQVILDRDLAALLRSHSNLHDLPSHLAADCSLEALEKFGIRQALRLAGNNKSYAAELLGVSRGSLYNKLKEYGMDSSDSPND